MRRYEDGREIYLSEWRERGEGNEVRLLESIDEGSWKLERK